MMLKESAEALGVTSAYLSALEHGKKGRPGPQLLEQIVKTMSLSQAQQAELMKSVADSDTRFEISSRSTPIAFETANAFARRLPSLSDIQLTKIKTILAE
jgi:transcriptional regulator with XRE-family HTH domain